MARKFLIVLVLFSLLLAFFYLKPILFKEAEEPELVERMPEGDFLLKMNLFDLAREFSTILYYHEVSMRDFITHDFILAQGKQYGFNLQNFAYGFLNKGEKDEWGLVLELADSSKVLSGIKRLDSMIPVSDTLIGDTKVYQLKSLDIQITYGKKWFFIYSGPKFQKKMYHIMYSQKGNMLPRWDEFVNKERFKDESIVVYSKAPALRKFGVETALFTTENDSSSVKIRVHLETFENLGFKLKDSAQSFHYNPVLPHLNLALDISDFRQQKSNQLYKFLARQARKIGFPLEAFLEGWNGEISYIENGKTTIKETVVESVMDENFEYTEIKTEVPKEIEMMALRLGTNAQQRNLISQLFAKGIVRKDGAHYYALLSPPLNMRLEPDNIYLYSSPRLPKLLSQEVNFGRVKYKNYILDFKVDRVGTRSLEGSVTLEAKQLLKQWNILK